LPKAGSRSARSRWSWLLIVVAILAPWVSQQNPYDLTQLNIMTTCCAGERSLDGKLYWLGTDEQGRDMVSAISTACA